MQRLSPLRLLDPFCSNSRFSPATITLHFGLAPAQPESHLQWHTPPDVQDQQAPTRGSCLELADWTLEGDDKRSMLRLLHHLGGILFSLGLSLYVLFSHCALSSWSHLRNFHHFLHHLAIRDSTFSPKFAEKMITVIRQWRSPFLPLTEWHPACTIGISTIFSMVWICGTAICFTTGTSMTFAVPAGCQLLKLKVRAPIFGWNRGWCLSPVNQGRFHQQNQMSEFICVRIESTLSSPDLVSFSSHPICTSLSLIWQCTEWSKGPQTMKPQPQNSLSQSRLHPIKHTTCGFTPLAPSRWFQSHSPPPVFPLAPALVHACASAQGCGCACPQTSDKKRTQVANHPIKMKRILSS